MAHHAADPHQREDRRRAAAAGRNRTRPAPPPRAPQWTVELGIGAGLAPVQIHAGDCHMASKRRRPVRGPWRIRGGSDLSGRRGGEPVGGLASVSSSACSVVSCDGRRRCMTGPGTLRVTTGVRPLLGRCA
ncbi:DUF6233 domain-containing protein [Streptomyces sp. NBC_00016]|uniref:DUF6233 domain-containing protein n=1 Tax=Streptomyces sp. NBC_00016 TaxID=2975622 RepID=UPI003246FCCE